MAYANALVPVTPGTGKPPLYGTVVAAAAKQAKMHEWIEPRSAIKKQQQQQKKRAAAPDEEDVKVKGKALDSLFDGGVDLMLIDAEGAECFVIDGARNTIANSPDLKLILEWDPHSYRTGSPERRSSIENMWSFLLKDQGLSVSRIDPSSYSPLSGAVALVPITEDELYQTPHSDLLLHRPQQAKVRSTTQPPSIGTINRAP